MCPLGRVLRTPYMCELLRTLLRTPSMRSSQNPLLRTRVNKGKKSREAEVSLVDQGEAVALAAAIVVDVVGVLEIFRARSSELRNAV